MTFRRSIMSLALGAFVSLGIVSDARADVLLNFAESAGSGVTSTVLGGGTQTDLSGTNIAVTVTNVAPVAGLPGMTPEWLTFDFKSTGVANAMLYSNGVFKQVFNGSFSIRSAPGGGGYNLLSGTSIGAIVTTDVNGVQSLSFTSNNTSSYDFTSSKGLQAPNFTFPTGLSFAFANVKGAATSKTAFTSSHGATLNSFTASVSGVISATPVPEPSTLALLGLGGIGMAFGAYRRRRAIAA